MIKRAAAKRSAPVFPPSSNLDSPPKTNPIRVDPNGAAKVSFTSMRSPMFAVFFFVAAGAELWAAPKPVTIFAFDDYTIPFKSNLYLTMVSGTKYPGNPVLQHGPAGSPDANRAQFYGSIIRIGEKFRMWYCAEDDATESIATGRSVSFRPAYAESTDGIHWIRPELGLVDYKGNTRNNLLHFTPKPDFSLTEPLYSSSYTNLTVQTPISATKWLCMGAFTIVKTPGIRRRCRPSILTQRRRLAVETRCSRHSISSVR